jgi:hypoxanthine phosphoribosyltransferase
MGAPPESEIEILTYEDFGVGIRWLAEQLVERDWIPDAILGVVRGGLFVSAALAYALDIKDVRHVNVEYYTDAGVVLPEPIVIGQEPYLSDLAGKRVLVADDVADTGATLQFVRSMLPDDAVVHVAVIYEKPHTTYSPDLAWRATDKWIRFPWIQVPPVRIAAAGRSSV